MQGSVLKTRLLPLSLSLLLSFSLCETPGPSGSSCVAVGRRWRQSEENKKDVAVLGTGPSPL